MWENLWLAEELIASYKRHCSMELVSLLFGWLVGCLVICLFVYVCIYLFIYFLNSGWISKNYCIFCDLSEVFNETHWQLISLPCWLAVCFFCYHMLCKNGFFYLKISMWGGTDKIKKFLLSSCLYHSIHPPYLPYTFTYHYCCLILLIGSTAKCNKQNLVISAINDQGQLHPLVNNCKLL